MSYATIKGYFKRRLGSFKLSEAQNGINLANESENFNMKYFIENAETSLGEGDNLATRFFPKRVMTIHLAFKTSESLFVKEYDNAHNLLQNILRDIHSSQNYRVDNIRYCRFSNMKVSVESDYILADLVFIAEDSLDYVTA